MIWQKFKYFSEDKCGGIYAVVKYILVLVRHNLIQIDSIDGGTKEADWLGIEFLIEMCTTSNSWFNIILWEKLLNQDICILRHKNLLFQQTWEIGQPWMAYGLRFSCRILDPPYTEEVSG